MEREYEPRFTISDLEEATGIPARRIRYYIEQGLASPAAGRGRAAYYTPRHVEELERIRDMRERNLSHDEIRQALAPQIDTQPEQHPEETWTRTVLHPDLELHMRSDAPEHVRVLALRIQALAAQWMGADEDE